MIGTTISGLITELKQHPWTSLAAGVALAGMIVFLPVYLDAANVSNRILQLESTVSRGQQVATKQNLEGRMRELERDIFELESKIRESPNDEFLSKQLHKWRNDLRILEARHEAYLQSHPELINGN